MKDEEMAEQFANGYATPDLEASFRAYMFEASKEGFLAGLKAGRPQWHDLRKDPNDLPEKMILGSREVYIEYKDGVTDFAYYRFDKKSWVRSENEELAENVIAWCEIPQFNSEV